MEIDFNFMPSSIWDYQDNRFHFQKPPAKRVLQMAFLFLLFSIHFKEKRGYCLVASYI